VSVLAIVSRLAQAWRERVGVASRQALLGLLVLAVCAGAHLARIGRPWARGTTAALIVLVIGAMVWRWLAERRNFRDLRKTLAKVLLPSDRLLGERTLRAVSLLDRTGIDPTAGSQELARVHFERLISKASLSSVERAASRRAAGWRIALLVFILATGAAIAVSPMRVIEGLDVLVAVKGKAPLPLAWLDFTRVTAEPPAYLKSSERMVIPGLPTRQPEGTLLTVRGIPRRDGRRLVLTDGKTEVPFVADGSGGVVARWSVEQSGSVRVAARFGDVLIPELEDLPIEASVDQTPEVELEGAPKTVKLKEVSSIDLRYEASDDHGLRQIDIVLRAGGREDRRVLARLDGDSVFEQGGQALEARDPFLRRMFLPVHVTIEAKDNDPVRGPKWGSSEPITLIPPVTGEPEAARFKALTQARDELVELLAWQMSAEREKKKPKEAEHKQRARRVADRMRTAVGTAYGGLGVPRGLSAFLLGQMRVMERPLSAGENRVRRTEDVLLAIDVAVRGLSGRDAEAVSKRLADVVEEIADGAKQARETEKRTLGVARVDAALGAAKNGARELSTLGLLGRDLGSVAIADLGRVERARKADDLFHTELAARHLAARLRRPNPSFGGAGRGGVESGASQSKMGQLGEPSDASERFDQLAKELEQLAKDHAGDIGKVEKALSEAEESINLDGLRDEAKERADALRRAIDDLPQSSRAPGSARSSAALGREQANSMAQSLERLSLAEAVESGRDALSALEDAEKKAKNQASLDDWVDDGSLRDAKKQVKEQLAWAERQLAELKKKAADKSRAAVGAQSEREHQLGRRAGNLAGRGKSGETALPDDAVENLERAESIMHEAARAFAEGRGADGLELQREAQRLLERASSGETGQDEDESQAEARGGRERGGKDVSTGGEVPRAEDSKKAEDFRRRVLEGLGKSKDGRLTPAVKRYAEGLLR
jgi:hypothetical protein